MTKEEAISILGNFKRYISGGGVTDRKANKAIDMAIEALQTEAVQDEAVQKILGYLDNILHPIVSPDNWYVYSDLYDMIVELLFEEPECGSATKMREKTKYCPNCGAKMDKDGEREEK